MKKLAADNPKGGDAGFVGTATPMPWSLAEGDVHIKRHYLSAVSAREPVATAKARRVLRDSGLNEAADAAFCGSVCG